MIDFLERMSYVSTPEAPRALNVALLGCGVVGTEVARILITDAQNLAARVGAPLNLIGIAVRDASVPRADIIDPALLTTDALGLVARADLVVEVMGGIEPAKSYIEAAIAGGASVITANKALLAQDGPALYQAADAAGVDLSYEAAVAGAIPIIRPIRESLAGDTIKRVLGIVNGTTNYVLDQMTKNGLAFDQAVRQAQELGFAEADPTADVEGYDAAAKAAILASLAFHTRVSLAEVGRAGITNVTAEDVEWAKRSGHTIKLLAICERTNQGVSARVHPSLVPNDHPLANVNGAYNAVFVEAENAGSLMFYGQGAGGAPTSSAIMGDLVTAARNRLLAARGPGESAYADLPILAQDDTVTRYQIRLSVTDRSGVLHRITEVFSTHDVSIETMIQAPREDRAGSAYLILTTHAGRERALAATVAALEALEVVQEVTSVLRVEGF